jgi:PAB-dependent poly(A)-specific ribonuclease subunit 2
VAGFVGQGLTSYTSWFAHHDEVRDILVHDRGVISLGSRNVRVTHRRGLQRWDIKSTFAMAVTDSRGNGVENLLSMAYSGTSHSEVVAAGGQNNILLLNIDRGTIVKQVFLYFGYSAESRNQRQNGIRNYDVGELLSALR